MDQNTKRGRPSKLRLSQEQEEKYITTKSHARLAKEVGCKLSELKEYAAENGLDEESRLYWLDVSLERLKEKIDTAEEVSASDVNTLKSLLSPTTANRPGRPSEKKAFKQGMDAAEKDNEFWLKELERVTTLNRKNPV